MASRVRADRVPSLKIRCDCCRPRMATNAWGNPIEILPQTVASIDEAQLYIKAPRNDRLTHWVRLSLAAVGALPSTGPILCACCAPEEQKILGELKDGVLIIRARRHGRLHFVTLTGLRLAQLFAEACTIL